MSASSTAQGRADDQLQTPPQNLGDCAGASCLLLPHGGCHESDSPEPINKQRFSKLFQVQKVLTGLALVTPGLESPLSLLLGTQELYV